MSLPQSPRKKRKRYSDINIDMKIKNSDTISILKYYVIDLKPYSLNKQRIKPKRLYSNVKKLCASILVHSKYYIPTENSFYDVINEVYEFYMKIYSDITSEIRNNLLRIMNLEYNIAKLKFDFDIQNNSIQKQIHNLENTLSYREFALEFLKILCRTQIHIIQNNNGLIEFNKILKMCFKYYFFNCRHKFCNVFETDMQLKEIIETEYLFTIFMPEKSNITKKSIISMYDAVKNIPDCVDLK